MLTRTSGARSLHERGVGPSALVLPRPAVLCYGEICDQDGDHYAGYPCGDMIWHEYADEDGGDGDEKVRPDGYLNEVEFDECDKPCNAMWEEHARTYRLESDLSATMVDWITNVTNIHPHRHEDSNGLDDDCNFQVDEVEHTYSATGHDDLERVFPFVVLQAAICEPAAAAGVTLQARVFRLGDFEDKRCSSSTTVRVAHWASSSAPASRLS